jgi:uncharacterized protein
MNAVPSRRRILVAGASGLIGSALVAAARSAGHDVIRLVRRLPEASDEIAWNPAEGVLDPGALAGVDAIVNLAGENIAAGRWTGARRRRILFSRLEATRTLVDAIRRMPRRPAVLVNASAVGFYGARGDEVLGETSARGAGFLPDVCQAWERQAAAAGRFHVRTVWIRFGLVLARHGGALARLRPLFACGLGGPLGDGRQWTGWIAEADAAGAILHAIADEHCAGPVNAVAPELVTNAALAATLGRLLHRPARLPAPAWALRLAFGRMMADETLLASARVIPERLLAAGFPFRHPGLEGALRAALAIP